MNPRLTIAIPTFDRNDLLCTHVTRLLPQLTPEVRLTILDNSSPRPVSEDLARLLEKNSEAKVDIVRHQFNIGAAANILRCIELCQTPWIWILGDDDQPLDNAVA